MGHSYAQRPLLYHNLKNGKKFELVPAVEGTGLAVVSVGRGAAFGDLFNDGKIDVVINNMDGVPVLLRNVNPDHHHWVEIKLIGGPRARATPSAPRSISPPAACASAKTCSAAEAIVSSNDMRVHFGLGRRRQSRRRRNSLAQRQVEKIKLPAVDRIFTVEEGKGVTGAFCIGCSNSKP